MRYGVVVSLLLHALILAPLLFVLAPQFDAPARETMQTRFVAHTVSIDALQPRTPTPVQPEVPPRAETLEPVISKAKEASAVAPIPPDTVEPSKPEPPPEPEIVEAAEPPPEPDQAPLPEPEPATEPEQVAQAEPEPVQPEPEPEPELVKPQPEPPPEIERSIEIEPPQKVQAQEETPPAPQPPAPSERVAAIDEAPAAGATSPSQTSNTDEAGSGGTAPDPSYLMRIRALLEAHKTYPAMAQRRGMEGDVYLWFVINRAGRVLDYRIDKGSGYEMLDEEVERLIEQIAQFPPVPPEVDTDRLELVVPVSFRLAG
jgi:periplasmic protein TonB